MKKRPSEPGAADRDVTDFSAHREMVRAFIIRMVGEPLLAEDLVQDVFLRLQRSSATFEGKSSLKSWLYAISFNVVSDHFRSAKRRPAAIADHSIAADFLKCRDAEDDLLEKEMAVCIGKFVLELPGLQQKVVAFHDIAGLSHGELAPIVGISPGNSRVVLHRGRESLKALLQKNCIISFSDDAIPCELKTS